MQSTNSECGSPYLATNLFFFYTVIFLFLLRWLFHTPVLLIMYIIFCLFLHSSSGLLFYSLFDFALELDVPCVFGIKHDSSEVWDSFVLPYYNITWHLPSIYLSIYHLSTYLSIIYISTYLSTIIIYISRLLIKNQFIILKYTTIKKFGVRFFSFLIYSS